MARHKLRAKKGLKPGQVPGRIYVQRARRLGLTPIGHHAEDRRAGSCGRCGHFWTRHYRVIFPQLAGQKMKLGCLGGFYGNCACKRAGRVIN